MGSTTFLNKIVASQWCRSAVVRERKEEGKEGRILGTREARGESAEREGNTCSNAIVFAIAPPN